MTRHQRKAPVTGVLGVLGGCGGAGASSLAAAVAARGGGPEQWPLLVDIDPLGGGIDVALGAEHVEGPRWSGIRAEGSRFDPEQLADGLPRWGQVPFLSCDTATAPEAGAVSSVVSAATELGPVVIDLGRVDSAARAAAMELVDVVVLLVPGQVRAVSAASCIRSVIDDRMRERCRLVVRTSRHSTIGPDWVAELLGLPLAGVFVRDRGLATGADRGIDATRVGARTVALARTLLAGTALDRPAA